MVVAISTGVVKANEPKILGKFGGSFELTEGLDQNVLIKRKGTTGKVEPCPKILKDEKLMFERAISKFFFRS